MSAPNPYVIIDRDRSGMDSGEITYTINTSRVAEMSPNDLRDLAEMLEAAKDAVLRTPLLDGMPS